jgi:hypothetical protein
VANDNVYSWDEMVEVDCLFGSAKEAWADRECFIWVPEWLADELEAVAPRVIADPVRLAACNSGLEKLRREPPKLLSAYCAGDTTWVRLADREGAEEFKLIRKRDAVNYPGCWTKEQAVAAYNADHPDAPLLHIAR